MEDLGLINPSFDGGRDGGHGEDHISNLLIQSERELADEGELLLHSSLHREILEVGDVLLETVVDVAVLLLEGFLPEQEQFIVGSYFGVKGVEG